MFELIVEHEFCAAHAIMLRGAREPLHGHNFKVRIVLAGPDTSLDQDGLLVDFHDVQFALRDVCAPFENHNLNECAAFEHLNPSAENVARVICEQMQKRLAGAGVLQRGICIDSVCTTEAPGCSVLYRPYDQLRR